MGLVHSDIRGDFDAQTPQQQQALLTLMKQHQQHQQHRQPQQHLQQYQQHLPQLQQPPLLYQQQQVAVPSFESVGNAASAEGLIENGISDALNTMRNAEIYVEIAHAKHAEFITAYNAYVEALEQAQFAVEFSTAARAFIDNLNNGNVNINNVGVQSTHAQLQQQISQQQFAQQKLSNTLKNGGYSNSASTLKLPPHPAENQTMQMNSSNNTQKPGKGNSPFKNTSSGSSGSQRASTAGRR